MMPKIGERIGAIISTDEKTKKLFFLGYGIYKEDIIPSKEARGFLAEGLREYGRSNPTLKLDNGDIVYGCECWWGPEARMKQQIEGYQKAGYTIEIVRIGDIRKAYDEEQPPSEKT